MANHRFARASTTDRRRFLGLAVPALTAGMFGPRRTNGDTRSDDSSAPADTSVILLYLHGGASQLETYDLKLHAPEGYRSVFKAIRTSVPGMDVCELLPRQAAVAKRFSLIRSMSHDVNIHSDGGIVTLTGKRPTVLDPTSTSKSEHPDFGSITSKIRGYGSAGFPPYVTIPMSPYMTRPTYLGQQHAAFAVGDPSVERFRPAQLSLTAGDVHRLDDRRRLVDQLDRVRGEADRGMRGQAFSMLTSSAVSAAFDISRESERIRDRYGRHLWGQSCLLARRLAEAGTGVVNIYINTPKVGPDFTNWDDHIMNAGRPGHFAGFMKTRLPYLDECLSALIDDIYDRGLDRKIMVVAVGEFGRTPRLSANAQGTGRDHWPQAYTALVSGGGITGGQVVGATNARAEYPTTRPISPYDLLATMYRHLGIDPHRTLADQVGRPTPILFDGSPIQELFA